MFGLEGGGLKSGLSKIFEESIEEKIEKLFVTTSLVYLEKCLTICLTKKFISNHFHLSRQSTTKN
jgi:hypothetical protein